jgi:hypothetical protein
MTQLILSGVSERDIDFVLLEELFASSDFAQWFLSRLGIAATSSVVTIAHSVSTSTGESDIELTLQLDGQTHIVLIENKIDAILQPLQAERYRERAERYVRDGQCAYCHTALVAPKVYVGKDPQSLGFDSVVTYEAIRKWLRARRSQGRRAKFKSILIERALHRGSAGWRLVPDETATEFWRRYWELTKVLAPELRMPRPGIKPATSAFIYFRPIALPKDVRLVHKMPYGNVDLQFAGMAKEIKALQNRYAPLLEPGMEIVPASKSAAVRIAVPEIDLASPFPASEQAVREGIWAARLLLLWFKKTQG